MAGIVLPLVSLVHRRPRKRQTYLQGLGEWQLQRALSQHSVTGASARPTIHCALSHSFSPNPPVLLQVAERSLGDTNGSAPNRIRRGDRNRLLRLPAFLKQPTTSQIIVRDRIGQARRYRKTIL
jgi:hypothetical protein